MKPSIALAPIDRADLKDRIAQAAVDAVYSRYCSNSVAALESAVVALIGTPIPDEEDDENVLDVQRDRSRDSDRVSDLGLPEEQGRAAERLAALTPPPETNLMGSKCQYSEDVGMPEYRCAVSCQYKLSLALLDAARGLRRIVEEIDGTMNHGTWRDDKGVRLKDTPEWIALYLAIWEAGHAD